MKLFDSVRQMRYQHAMAKREPKDVRIGIRTTKTIKDKADEEAIRAHRSLSEWVELLIIEAVEPERRKAKRKVIKS